MNQYSISHTHWVETSVFLLANMRRASILDLDRNSAL
jgi:hypothetical protein